MHTLKNNDIVHCESQDQYDRIIDLAIKAGVPVYEPLKQCRYWREYPNLHFMGDILYGNCAPASCSSYNWRVEGEFIAKLFGLTPSEPCIRIGEHTVRFNDDGSIKVGCTSVYHDTLKAVHERATKKRG